MKEKWRDIPGFEGLYQVSSEGRVRSLDMRYVTHRVNCQYFNKSKKSTSKYVGVYWQKEKGKWCANISIKNKTKNLGYFSSQKKAHRAYLNAVNLNAA